MHGSLLYDLEPMPRAGQDSHRLLVGLSLLAAGCTPDKEASLAVDAITKFDLLRFMGRDACAPFQWAASRLLHFQIGKSSQVLRIHVGDSPEREPIMIPMQDIIAVFRKTLRC
jgi:hypothetical protein